jgi:CRISPR-associated protein Cmr1
MEDGAEGQRRVKMSQPLYMDVELEALTPVMMGGADFRAEVRPPSFRGMARVWLRALLGGIFGDDPAAVHAVERVVFGGTAQRSAVAIRTLSQPAVGALPVDRSEFPGVGYLFYSIYQTGRDAIQPAERFQLRLQTRPGEWAETQSDGYAINAENAWQLTLAALWLAVNLGGVGKRSRRGGGCLCFAEIPSGWPAVLPSPRLRSTTPRELADELGAGLSALRRAWAWPPAAEVHSPSSFNVLHPQTFDLYILDQTYPTWYQALDAIGQAFQAFRRREPHDYEGVKGVLARTRRALSDVHRAIFGLPLMFYFSSLYRELVGQGVPAREARPRVSATLTAPRGMVRPSPLWVRVARLAAADPAYVVQILLFRSRFLEDEHMVLRPGDRAMPPVQVQAPQDFSVVEAWFQHVEQHVAPLQSVTFI